MTSTPIKLLTLETFLKLPYIEESPAWEYIDGTALQKPMPKTRHAILQKHLLRAIDNCSEEYTTLPELRCTFGGRSVVPDVVVIKWDKIPFDEAGEPEDNFLQAPDWTIEILSPDQSSNRVTANILHCLKYGSQLGWLIDPSDRTILVFRPQQEPVIFSQSDRLPILAGIELEINAVQIFTWLKMKQTKIN